MVSHVRTAVLALVIVIFALAAIITESHAVPLQWSTGVGGNDHFYDFVGSFTWSGALADAATKSHLGQPGYLATITSAGENSFIRTSVTTTRVWVSGTDQVTEGDWKWAAGPEAGQSFWINGVTQPGFFAAWGPTEPNNAGNEDFLHINLYSPPNTWNDLRPNDFPLDVHFINTLPVPTASRHSRASGNPGDARHGDWMPAYAGMTFYWCRTYETDI